MPESISKRQLARRISTLEAASAVLVALAAEEGGSQHKEEMADDLLEIAEKLKEKI